MLVSFNYALFSHGHEAHNVCENGDLGLRCRTNLNIGEGHGAPPVDTCAVMLILTAACKNMRHVKYDSVDVDDGTALTSD